jgi:hypothetical protein
LDNGKCCDCESGMNGTSRQISFAFGSGSLAFNGANSVQLSTLLENVSLE